MKLYIHCLILLLFSANFCFSVIDRFEPSNWWIGMDDSSLQLMLKGQNIGGYTVETDDDSISIDRVERVESENYLFVYLKINKNAKPGVYPIKFYADGAFVQEILYPLNERRKGASQVKGFSNSDVIYLLMPDRFANGNPDNDRIEGMLETKIDRQDPYARHGGDLKGVIDHLDYLKDLGVTAVWLNPVLENNQPQQSYHGYATTDFYNVDSRYGSNEEYLQLADELRKRGMKLVMDMIFNHCGHKHWWMEDLPEKSWINYADKPVITNHRRTSNSDPYAVESDALLMRQGWFVTQMPDLNLDNTRMADYMIQNSIWWIEYLGLNGIRMDTHPYPDKYAMSKWAGRVMKEYPYFNLTGEEWSENPVVVSYWLNDQKNPDGYDGNMPSMLDFPLQVALEKALKTEETWGSGLVHLYEMLANDVVYPNPNNLVTFLGNHDMPRFFMEIGQNVHLYKNGLTVLLTTRGIPHLYYGDEILMTHVEGNDHGNIRKDFPGGWSGDNKDVFLGQNLTFQEQYALSFTKKVLNWRQNKTVIHSGKLTHYAPEHGTYVYFRHNEADTVMVVINKNTEKYRLNLDRFDEFLSAKKSLYDIQTGESYDASGDLELLPLQPYIFELR